MDGDLLPGREQEMINVLPVTRNETLRFWTVGLYLDFTPPRGVTGADGGFRNHCRGGYLASLCVHPSLETMAV